MPVLAVEMSEYGPPSVLRVVERPASDPGPGEVVVAPVVCGVNRADCFIRAGVWTQRGGWPYVPGLETCGRIVRVGEGVGEGVGEAGGWRVGDEVITMMRRLGGIHGERAGGYQSEVCVPASTLARVPRVMGVERAALLGLPAVTAAIGLSRLGVAAGQRLLVQGGTSAVGLAAIVLAKRAGAVVAATTTRAEKAETVRRAGADEVVVTRDGAWGARVAPVDRVLDVVGEATFATTVERIADGGRYLLVGGTSGARFSFDGWNLMREVALTGYSSETLDALQLQAAVDRIAAVVPAVEPVEVHRFALADAAAAHAELESGRRAGRFVLVP